MLKTLFFIFALTTTHVAYSETRIIDGDPEPKDPGDDGKTTILGIDSDNDGVRDDIEIWINNRFPDLTSSKMYNLRMGFKQLAISDSEIFKYAKDPEKVSQAYLEGLDATRCMKKINSEKAKDMRSLLAAQDEIIKYRKEFERQFYNTKERIFEELKTRKFMHGVTLQAPEKKPNGCYFEVKK